MQFFLYFFLKLNQGPCANETRPKDRQTSHLITEIEKQWPGHYCNAEMDGDMILGRKVFGQQEARSKISEWCGLIILSFVSLMVMWLRISISQMNQLIRPEERTSGAIYVILTFHEKKLPVYSILTFWDRVIMWYSTHVLSYWYIMWYFQCDTFDT